MGRRKDIRVFLLFDSITVRKWIAGHPSHGQGIRIIGEAQNPLKALAEIKRLQPDVVIMHSQDRNRFGMDMLQGIRNYSPEAKVIMLTNSRHHLHHRNYQDAGPDLLLNTFTEWQKIPEILRRLQGEPDAA